VTGVDGEELRRASLAVGVHDLDVQVEVLHDGERAVAVGGCVCGRERNDENDI
jgi:hypothetical protein